jgi:hypothetical protein
MHCGAAQRTQERHCCKYPGLPTVQLPSPSTSTSTTGHTPRGHWASSQCALACLPLAPGLLRAVWLGEALPRPCSVLALHFHMFQHLNPISSPSKHRTSADASHLLHAFALLAYCLPSVRQHGAGALCSERSHHDAHHPTQIGPVTRRPALSSSRLPAVIRPQSPALTTHRHALSPPQPLVGDE